MPTLASNSKRIAVLIADDHAVVRNGLRYAVANEPDMSVAGEASDGLEAEHQALLVRPDVIIMDIRMPHRDGLTSMVAIKQQLASVKVLLLTISEEEDDLF
ncbi:MAG: response regulator transcription factor [Chloroflexi bacterium]|nr:response regulator transcription factor [Chloroflexota bacterium]